MSKLRFIDIDGKRHLWREILELRRQQKKAPARAQQPVLFELKDDYCPLSERNAPGRYLEPSPLLDRKTPSKMEAVFPAHPWMRTVADMTTPWLS